MTDLPPDCDIRAAELVWVNLEDVYGPAREIIAAVIADAGRLRRVPRLPLVFWSKGGEFRGCRFRIVGLRDPDGRWRAITHLLAL